MFQSISDLPHMIRSYHSGYSQLSDFNPNQQQQILTHFCQNLFKFQKWKLKHSLCLFLIFWLMSAHLIMVFERPFELESKAMEEKSLKERRLKVVEALQWITMHLPTDSTEWTKTANHLLDWHGRLPKVQQNFEPTNSYHLILTLITGNSSPETPKHPYSTSTHLFLIFYLPFGLFLYYHFLWQLSALVHKLKFHLFLTFIFCLTIFGLLCLFVKWRSDGDFNASVEAAFNWSMFLANLKWICHSNTNFFTQLAIHSFTWTLIFTLYRHLKDLKEACYEKLVRFSIDFYYYYDNLSGRQTTTTIFNNRDFRSKQLQTVLWEFREKSLLNRLFLLMVFDDEGRDVKWLERRVEESLV